MRITDAKALSGFRLELQFDDGKHGMVDLSSLVGRGVFAAWQEPSLFQQVSVTPQGAVEWPHEIDLCPDTLYMWMTGKSVEEVLPALQGRGLHA